MRTESRCSRVGGRAIHRARYYNPYLCRFISSDPSGFGGGLNWFAYANGNPVSYLDPFGLGAIGEPPASSWLSSSSVDQNMVTTITCHGVSAGGFNGNINDFSGLTTISGVSPQDAAAFDNFAYALQDEGPQLVTELALLTATAGLGASPLNVTTETPSVGGLDLAEGDGSLVLMKDGQLVDQQPVTFMTTHADFATKNGAVLADGSLAPGYWIGTVGKVNGNIVALNSQTFYQNQMANAAATIALRSIFH
jgi:hypothetical protein